MLFWARIGGFPGIRLSWAFAGSVCILLGATVASGQCQYQVTVIQAPECAIFGFPPTFGRGMNNLGHVVGYHRDCGFLAASDDAFVWTPESGLVTLSFPAGTIRKRAFDINDSGAIVGTFDLSGDGLGDLGFLYEGGAWVAMHPPGAGLFSGSPALNNVGQVVGYRNNADNTRQFAFIWRKGVFVDIPPTAPPKFGNSSYALDINKNGTVVGNMEWGPDYNDHAFRWKKGRMSDLGVIPGGFTGKATAINDVGQIAVGGKFFPDHPRGFISGGFLWDNGDWTNLGMLSGYDSMAVTDLNNAGQVVGWVRAINSDGGFDRPFIWQNGVMTDLDELIPPNLDIFIGKPASINEAGQIAGTAGFEGHIVAVLLTPLDPPPGDLDGDCRVRVPDLLTLLAAWGPCSPKLDCRADLNNDGTVNQLDLVLLIENWG